MAKPKVEASDPRRAALAKHAGSRNTLEFTEPKLLHGKIAFHKGDIVEFEDPAVAAFFDIAFNGTEFTDKKPTRFITNEDINFDPDDPRGNETIDPHTIIGHGREGVAAGTTAHQAAGGKPATGSGHAPLGVHDVTSSAEG
jgi:hypothetical protein